jgi:hypothetical protein
MRDRLTATPSTSRHKLANGTPDKPQKPGSINVTKMAMPGEPQGLEP